MTAYTGFVDNSSMLAHYKLLELIRDICLAEGWTVLRYNTSIANRELIVMAPGLSGTEQIFCGVYCYQDVANDYYNIAVATMKGYMAGHTFLTQPGISPICGVPTHNVRIDYWLSINSQRLNGALKVGTPVYESFSIGKMNQYGTPTQYPQPLIAAGMLVGATATRYSDTSHSMPYKGARDNMRMHFNDGTWRAPSCYPWAGGLSTNVRPNEPTYGLMPVQLFDSANIYGELDGIFHITGFNNVVENTLTIGGKNYIVIQDVARTSFGDYYALEMS